MPADLFAQPNGSILPPAHLQVVRASFQATEPFNWELLQGFDGLRVLTYTASVQTVAQFLDFGYRDFECIFGCERVIGNVRDVVAVQNEGAGLHAALAGAAADRRAPHPAGARSPALP